ncbi:MAG: hypothetical protein JXL97_10365 [Bacteroidales bacterium]|nr:hypothetical protein [Bacteroidales bacterium]
MKRTYLFFVLVLALSLFNSCRQDDIYNLAYGIRHDKTLDEYEAVAANSSPYNTADYPDFSPVVMFSYSLDGSNYEDYGSGLR